MTENELVTHLMDYLKINGWEITDHCLGQKHGIDIIAQKNSKELIIEAKGAKANSDSLNKRREYFDSGQIKTHFGKAIVKILEEQAKNPNRLFAIAHPDDIEIKRIVGPLTGSLKRLNIKHYWVKLDGTVTED